MSDERRSHEKIRRNADRVRERLAATLAQSRIAIARDKRTNERAGVRDSVEPLGGERNATHSGKRTPKRREDGEVGDEPSRVQTTDADR
jgi:hypothetical protein